MGKVGILTQPVGWNYGAVLQNWALQQILISLGYSPITIKHHGGNWVYRTYRWFRDLFVYIVKQAVRSYTRKCSKLPWEQRPYTKLHQFVENHIHRTDYMPLTRAKEILKKDIDKIVVGSDQVWRPKYNGKKLNSLYCKFLNDNSKIPVISYAASFGVSTWEYTESQTQMAQKEIMKFKAISVREDSAIELCKKYLHRDAVLVLDPTLLISKNGYKELISEKDIESLPEKFVGVYILDLSPEKKEFVEVLCQKLGLAPFYFGNPDVDGTDVVSVETWLAAIMMSSFVITDSFHGTAFAINFRRPFISLVNYRRGVDRFESLLKIFGLESRMVDLYDKHKIDDLIIRQIEWNTVENIQDSEKQKALEFLKAYL